MLNEISSNSYGRQSKNDSYFYSSHSESLVQRCVIIQRDNNGFGLTVSGDNPVFVQSIKKDGPAYKAGVLEGDKIVKVNGTVVTHCNHLDVVKLIKKGSYVALTLLGVPPYKSGKSYQKTSPTLSHANSFSKHLYKSRSSIDHESKKKLVSLKLQSLFKMLDQETRRLEDLQRNFKYGGYDEKLQYEINACHNQILAINQKIRSLYQLHNTPKSSNTESLSSLDKVLCKMSEKESVDYSKSSSSIDKPIFEISERTPHGFLDMNTKSPKPDYSPSPFVEKQKFDHSSNQPRTSSPEFSRIYESIDDDDDTNLSSNLKFELDFNSENVSPLNSSKIINPKTTAKNPSLKSCQSFNVKSDSNTAFSDPRLQMCFLNSLNQASFFRHPSTMMEREKNLTSLSQDDSENMSDNVPFHNIVALKNNPAHLFIFLNYTICNSNPNPLIFYLITDVYTSSCGLRDLRRFAYEIHSSFTVPNAPLSVKVSQAAIDQIDNSLQSNIESENVLKFLFRLARKSALLSIKETLKEFCGMKKSGLSALKDELSQLPYDSTDKTKSLKLAEKVIMPILDVIRTSKVEECIRAVCINDKDCLLLSAVLTICKYYGIKFVEKSFNSLMETLSEHGLLFCSKDGRSNRFKLSSFVKAKDKMFVKEHSFILYHYHALTFCNFCHNILTGVGYQGYSCTNCNYNTHRNCIDHLEEQCVGIPKRMKIASNSSSSSISQVKSFSQPDRSSKSFMGNIMKKFENSNNKSPIQTSNEKLKNLTFQTSSEESLSFDGLEERDKFSLKLEKLKAHFENEEQLDNKKIMQSKKANVPLPTVSRSESMKTHSETINHYRKQSDPNLPRSKSHERVNPLSTIEIRRYLKKRRRFIFKVIEKADENEITYVIKWEHWDLMG